MFKILDSVKMFRAKLFTLKSPITYWKNDTSGQLNTNVESILISTNNRGSFYFISKHSIQGIPFERALLSALNRVLLIN